jgi:hypothetical protein
VAQQWAEGVHGRLLDSGGGLLVLSRRLLSLPHQNSAGARYLRIRQLALPASPATAGKPPLQHAWKASNKKPLPQATGNPIQNQSLSIFFSLVTVIIS